MDILPPSPHDGFLRLPIPDLTATPLMDSVAKAAARRAEQDLLVQANEASPRWLCDAAELNRDRGRLAIAIDYAGRAIAAAKRDGLTFELARGYSIRASILRIQGNFDSAAADFDEVRTMTIGDRGQLVSALYEEGLGMILLRSLGGSVYEFEEAGAKLTKASELYRELGDVSGQIRCQIGLASIRSGRGVYFAAAEEVDAGIALAVKNGNWKYMGQLLGCAAFAFRDQGYRQNIHELFQLSIDWATYTGDVVQRIRALGGQAVYHRFHLEAGDQREYDYIVAMLCQAIREGQEIGVGPLVLENQIELARTYEKVGDRDAQRRALHLAEQAAENEAFEGANRLFNWSEFIAGRLDSSREERYALRLEEAIEGSSEPFFVFDPTKGSDADRFDLINEFRNSAANEMLGLKKTDIRLLPDLAKEPLFEGLVEPLERAAQEREPYEDEVTVTAEDFRQAWYARRVVPAGEGAVVTFRDVTSQRRIEEALREAATQAREADQAKSEFLANMSHEVRTPINGVLGLARLMRDLALEPTAQKYVDGIISSGTILLKVIGDVLDLSKIEARKMQVTVGPLNLQAVVDEVLGLFLGRASEAGLALAGSVDPALPAVVLLDGTYLRQVLANLVSNAIKFTSQGSIKVAAKLKDGSIEFTVTDTGVGVPADLIDSIFEPFHQGFDEADWGGTGLGLTISKKLVELMGGTISAQSKVGEGSKFRFTLPLIEVPAGAAQEAPSPVEDHIRFDGKHVLIVDDNAVNTLVAEGMAARLGCTVSVAQNGRDALKLMESEPFDAVLMDMRMPVMDGLEATRVHRAYEEHTGSHLPIIALTAGALTQERDACLAAGMDDYLAKPFTLTTLREALFRAIG
jgi:signal transduction histidine kinase/ActR/RegA family two-component response regulator